MQVQCKHVDDCSLNGTFIFDINVKTRGERDTLLLCQDCYERLVGVVVVSVLDAMVHRLKSEVKCQS